MSFCSVVEATSTSYVLTAFCYTIDDADLFYSGAHQAFLEKMLISVNKKAMLSLSFMSKRSTYHCWFNSSTNTYRFLNRVLTGFQEMLGQPLSTNFFGRGATRGKALTPPFCCNFPPFPVEVDHFSLLDLGVGDSSPLLSLRR